MSERGRINGWRCEPSPVTSEARPYCGQITYAIHVHRGVTPMFLACHASGHEPDHPDNPCSGNGVSLMYPDGDPPPHVIGAVAWEWYMPDAVEIKRLRKRERQGKENPGVVDHVERGGLLLRPLTDAGRALLPVAV